MIHSAFDPMDIAGLHQWMQQQAGDNSQRRQRLLHNLSRAMTEELTPRQQEMLHLYYYEKLNMGPDRGASGGQQVHRVPHLVPCAAQIASHLAI